VDYNQSLTPADAVERLRHLDDLGLAWIEEPTLAHDYEGHAHIAREIHTPIAARIGAFAIWNTQLKLVPATT
jgi:mandelate racemase